MTQEDYKTPPRLTRRHSRAGLISCALFGLVVVAQLLLTAFEASLIDLSPTIERWLILAVVVLPALLGAAFGARGVLQVGQKRLLAIVGLTLNLLAAFLIIAILFIAG